MKLLLDQAQIVMDDFYQSFRPANGFLTIQDCARRLVDERDAELEREFLVQYQQNKRSFPIVNSDWVSHEMVDLKQMDNNQWYGDVCTKLFEFPFDSKGTAIQSIQPYGGTGCSNFIRIDKAQAWQVCLAPSSDEAFFALEKCRILLYNFFGCTNKLDVLIVPSQAALPYEQQTIPDGKAATIREVVLNKMFRDYQAKKGQIKMNIDGNQNPQPNETGLNYEGLKTK